MTEIGNHGGKRMEPSFAVASLIQFWAIVFFLVSLAVGVVSTAVIFWMGSIKEEYLTSDIAEANERVAVLDNETARLSAEAEASKDRAAQAELALASLRKQIEPRTIDFLAFSEDLKSGPKAHVRIIFPRDDIESHNLSMQIFFGLMAAGWTADHPQPIQPGDDNFSDFGGDLSSKVPSAMAAGGNITGISILTGREGSSASLALRNALLKTGLPITSSTGTYPITEDVRVVVGSKP